MAKKKKQAEVTNDKDKALELTMMSLEKQFGKGIVMTGNSVDFPDIDRIPSGSASLDEALNGGYAKGRMIEIYGPPSAGKTTLALHAIAETQKAGGKCAFVDAEHALDVYYAEDIGVNIQELLISQPENGEQCLNVTKMLVNSGAIDLIVVDSVAALTPRAELEGDIGDNKPGAQARLMSQAMRILTGNAKKTNTAIIFINQIRMKIGIMFGCFHYNARVLLADGTTEKIGKIVNQQLPLEILSVNERGVATKKKIIDWHNNGPAEKFIQVVVEYPHVSGRSNLPIGDDHTLLTPYGEKKVSELSVGDSVLVRSKDYRCRQDIVVGMLLGDASIRVNDAGNTAKMRIKHGEKQNDYCIKKTTWFPDAFLGSSGVDKQGRFWWDSKSTNEFVWLAKYKEGSAVRYADRELVESINESSIAIWYLDDGTFSGSYKYWGWGKSTIYATKLDRESKILIADRFEQLGFPRPSLTKKGFSFSGEKNQKFQSIIAPYVPKSMSYKIHPKLRDNCVNCLARQRIDYNPIDCLIEAKIVDIYEKPITPGQPNKFDITVEDSHCYFVDNVLVHNSPETVAGGEALKFYSSQRLDIRRIGVISDGDNKTGIRTRVKVAKNKTGPPFKMTELNIMFGKGIDSAMDLLDMAVTMGFVEKKGAWFSYNNQQLGQGASNAAKFLEENSNIASEIRDKLKG